MSKLDYLRENLEMCDEIILDALCMRYRIVEDITTYKRKKNLAIVQPEVEEHNRKLLLSHMAGNRHTENMMDVFETILLNSKKIQFNQLFDYNIVLIGFMGSGKSTISRALCNVFAMDVIEMDQVIAEREGMSISEIFEVHGEEYFRNLETGLLRELQSRKGVVISCGGGVPMREENVVEMKKNGKVILLTAKPETILERVRGSHERPLLENNKNVDFISDLMEKRRIKYETAADIIIHTDGKSEFEICEEIISYAKKK
ncbi:shikimate kinase [Lachnospiraceae bacterium 47-T17]